jgi:hypothetical protein
MYEAIGKFSLMDESLLADYPKLVEFQTNMLELSGMREFEAKASEINFTVLLLGWARSREAEGKRY